MRFSVPFGYDAVGKVDREIHDGHNYRLEWHEIDVEEIEAVNAPIATRWSGGETVFLNGRHYAQPYHVTRPFSYPAGPWLPEISANDLSSLRTQDMSRKSKVPALELVVSALSPRQVGAFQDFNVKRREKRPPQFVWSNVDERRAEIEQLAESFIIVDDQVLVATNEPVYRVSNWRDKTAIDVLLTSPIAANIRREKEKFCFFRADRFDDAMEFATRGARGVEVTTCTPIEVMIPNSIKVLDDLMALVNAVNEALEIGKANVLDYMSTEQAMTWLRLRDVVRLPIAQLNESDILLEHLTAYIGVLRTLPRNLGEQLESICQQSDRWQMRPITSARGH